MIIYIIFCDYFFRGNYFTHTFRDVFKEGLGELREFGGLKNG